MIYLLLSYVFCYALGFLLWKNSSRLRKYLAYFLWTVTYLLLFSIFYCIWYCHRLLPAPIQKEIFQGISYSRIIQLKPRHLVIHIVNIDLDVKGIKFFVTPENKTKGYSLAAQTTSKFLKKYGTQVAINASGFHPWYANGPLFYYPHRGDPVDPLGIIISNGNAYSLGDPNEKTIYFSKDNKVSIDKPLPDAFNAISGFSVLLRDGNTIGEGVGWQYNIEPRSSIGIDKSGRLLSLFVIDGRQPNYSKGVSLKELSQIMLKNGCYNALNLDGGGSSTLVCEGVDGNPEILNSPIHGRVPPGRERPIATHLGIYALDLNSPQLSEESK